MELFRKIKCLSALLLIMSVLSCRMEDAVVVVGVSFEPEIESNYEHEKGEWTVMVYMCADNSLEKAALVDINEMENSTFDFEKNNVVLLVDFNSKKEGYDGEWKGTRMYEVRHDKMGMNDKIVSQRICCRELGLSCRNESKIDMSDPSVLRNFVSSTKQYYPADHYAFLMWGECSGYSGRKERALAFDDTSMSYMDNKTFSTSLFEGLNEKFELLAMDSCFGSEIELLMEFERGTDYFLGMEGLQKVEGWDYSSLFSALDSDCVGGKEFGQKIMGSQREKNVSLVDLSMVMELCGQFDSFAKKAANSIKNKSDAIKTRNEILNSNCCFKSYEAPVNPVYVDIKRLAEEFNSSDLTDVLEKTVQCSDAGYGGVGVFFCNLDKDGNLIHKIPDDYVRGKSEDNCTFVNGTENYVFTQERKGTLLDKLFGNYF